ncbi:MAG: sugar phosphate isomerase/epimerase [Chloroflexi bacterium]|nr:sugar phosphate isomerase/epimerase [Chloroflexota bacterium]
MAKIAVQLYTVREALKGDYEGVIRQIAAMGYDGVEPAGMYGAGPREARALFDSLGLAVPSAHLGLLDDAAGRAQALDNAAILGCQYAVVPFIPAEQFATVDLVIEQCNRLNAALPDVKAHGMQLLYHNHWWEFTVKPELGGRTAIDVMKEHLDPAIGFEVDTYWAQHAGLDPAAVVAQLGDRAPLLHMKDGHPGTDQAMLAVGDGVVDFKAIVSASTAGWWISELDRHDGDMLTAIRRSAAYLKTL